MDPVTRFVRSAWEGRAPLWKVFWLGGELFGSALAVVLFVVIRPGPVTPIAVLCSLPYAVWIGVSIWRCAYNVRKRQWGDLARIYLIVAVPMTVFGLVRVLDAAT